jgi:hypothetical protein
VRVLGLVLGRVGHRKREAIDQLRVEFAFPQPALVGSLLQFLRNFTAQFLERPFKEFGSGSAVVARILSRHWQTGLFGVAHDASHRRLTRGLFTVTQYLREKRPDHDGGRVDAVQAEQAAMLGEDSLDAFGRQNLGKRQSLTPQKRVGNFLKTLAASTRRMWYLCNHEKTLLGFSPAVLPRRASYS